MALGIYARVLQTLRLESGLGSIAEDDVLGRKLQDANLEPKSRAPKRSKRPAIPPNLVTPMKDATSASAAKQSEGRQ